MVRLSIVIPVVDRSSLLDDTLVSVLENRPADCEIVVVHAVPYDDPYQLGNEVRFVQAPAKADIAGCLGIGIDASRAAVVHLLACGIEVCPGWADAAMRHFRNPQIAAVVPAIVRSDDPNEVISAGFGYLAEGVVWRLAQGEQTTGIDCECEELCGPDGLAGFYRKSALDAVGGYASRGDLAHAAIDTGLAFRQAGLTSVVEPRCMARAPSTAARKATGFRHGCEAERLFWRWASAHGRLRSLMAHAALVAGECTIGLWRPSMLLQLAGRFCGFSLSLLGNRPRPSATCESSDAASILSSPQFSTARCDEERHAA